MLPDKLYYSIAEVAEHFKVAPSLLRYWEKEFPAISPKRNRRGVRFYTKNDISEIAIIYDLVKTRGFTLNGAKEELHRKQPKNPADLLETLTGIRDFIQNLRNDLDENRR